MCCELEVQDYPTVIMRGMRCGEFLAYCDILDQPDGTKLFLISDNHLWSCPECIESYGGRQEYAWIKATKVEQVELGGFEYRVRVEVPPPGFFAALVTTGAA
jgi:hypothetical protein